jgi:hypothetical protein
MTTTTQTTKQTQAQLAAELVKGLRGIRAVERPSHMRVEVASTEKQIAFVSGKRLHVPSGLIPEGWTGAVKSGRAVLPLGDDRTASRELVQDVAKVYAAKRAAGMKAAKAADASTTSKPARTRKTPAKAKPQAKPAAVA